MSRSTVAISFVGITISEKGDLALEDCKRVRVVRGAYAGRSQSSLFCSTSRSCH
jgi:hypothetical protein